MCWFICLCCVSALLLNPSASLSNASSTASIRGTSCCIDYQLNILTCMLLRTPQHTSAVLLMHLPAIPSCLTPACHPPLQEALIRHHFLQQTPRLKLHLARDDLMVLVLDVADKSLLSGKVSRAADEQDVLKAVANCPMIVVVISLGLCCMAVAVTVFTRSFCCLFNEAASWFC